MTKIYEIWPGRNRFFFLGCITGPVKDFFAYLSFYICLLAAIIPYSMFMITKIW